MTATSAITDSTSLTKAIIETCVDCWMKVRSLVSRDTSWPVVSRVEARVVGR